MTWCLMRAVLKDRLGLKDEDIVTLSEADGAKDDDPAADPGEHRQGMGGLKKKAQATKDARVVVFLSGHGTRQPDLLRKPGDVKPDGMCEVFLPADFGRLGCGRKTTEELHHRLRIA